MTIITVIPEKMLYDFLLKRREIIHSSLKPGFRSLCSANNEHTELVFGNYLIKHVKNLTMTIKLRRNEGYYQSKYSSNKYSKDYAKSNSRQFFLGQGRGASRKNPGRSEQVTGNINSRIRGMFKRYYSKFSWATNCWTYSRVSETHFK